MTSEKVDVARPDKWEFFNHIKEESIKDPLYFTKMMLAAVGSNLIQFVIRIAIYVLVLYPLLTSILHIPTGVASLLVMASIVLYYSALSIYHKLVKDIKNNSKEEKKSGLSGV